MSLLPYIWGKSVVKACVKFVMFLEGSMSNQQNQMKWILFWVFLILFILMVLGTLGMVFFGFGSPTESERSLMVKGLIGEVAACIIALFYSIFGLRKTNEEPDNIEDLKEEIKLLHKSIEKLNKPYPEKNNNTDKPINLKSEKSDFESAIESFNIPPPFPIDEYNLKPAPKEIDDDISSVKPFDEKHRMESYEGMKVQWAVRFSSISEHGDLYHISADTGVLIFKIKFKLNKKLGGRFRHLEKGTVFWVCGAIKSVDNLGIDLDDVSVFFGDET